MEHDETAEHYLESLRTRIQPGSRSPEDAAALLATHTFTGGELWPDWESLLATGGDACKRALTHLERVWGETLPNLRSLRHAFRERVLRAHHARYRCLSVDPPATRESVAAWEALYGTLPPHTRSLLLETGAVYGGYDQESFSLSTDSEMFVPLGEEASFDWFMMDSEELSSAAHILGHILRMFAAGRQEPVNSRSVEGDGEPARVAHIWSFYEGNHGDDNLLLVLAGPLADTVIAWSNLQHGGGEVIVAGHIVDVLLEGYFEGFSLFILEEDEPDAFLQRHGRYASQGLRFVEHGMLD